MNEKLRRIELGIEEQLRGLAEAGELSGLPGEGAPLPDDDPDAGEDWAARHVLRNAGAVPEWAEMRREIDEGRERLVRRLRSHRAWLANRAELLVGLSAERIVEAARATGERDARVQPELSAALAELNALVARYDLLVVPTLQLRPLTPERLRELAER